MPEQWPPDPAAGETPHQCDRCDTVVSQAFHRQWSDNDGHLDGCRECLPRSVRFGEDPYDRDRDDIEFDVEAPNLHTNPAPSSRIMDKYESDE